MACYLMLLPEVALVLRMGWVMVLLILKLQRFAEGSAMHLHDPVPFQFAGQAWDR